MANCLNNEHIWVYEIPYHRYCGECKIEELFNPDLNIWEKMDVDPPTCADDDHIWILAESEHYRCCQICYKNETFFVNHGWIEDSSNLTS